MTIVLLTTGGVFRIYGTRRFRHRVAKAVVQSGMGVTWADER